MKVTVVPAQITTVEDRIAGNLGVSQLFLLAGPIFISSALFVILPPFYHNAAYKLVIITMLFVIGGLLAIRIKGKIVLFWLLSLLRYNLRPRYYVYDKRSMHGREDYKNGVATELEDKPIPVTRKIRETLELSPSDVFALQNLIDNPAANLSFETNKKGKLYVRITEIKPEV